MSAVVQVRRSAVLADGARARRGAAATARTGAVVRQSDLSALSDEMATLYGRIRTAAREGVEGTADLLSSYSVFLSAWRHQLEEWGYDEDLSLPWYRVDPFKARENQDVFAEYKSRNVGYGVRYAKLKYPGVAASDLPSDYGAALPPVVPGTATDSTSEPEPTPSSPLARPAPPKSVMVAVLVVGLAGVLGGLYLLTRSATA